MAQRGASIPVGIDGIDTQSLTTIAVVVGGIVALATFVKGLLEFTEQVTQRRADQLIAMRRRLKEDSKLSNVCSLFVDGPDEKLGGIPLEDRLVFVGLFEEVALMMNSGLIRLEVAHQLFGFYAIACEDSTHFWVGMDKESHYWALFHDFVAQMKQAETAFVYRRRDFNFR